MRTVKYYIYFTPVFSAELWTVSMWLENQTSSSSSFLFWFPSMGQVFKQFTPSLPIFCQLLHLPLCPVNTIHMSVNSLPHVFIGHPLCPVHINHVSEFSSSRIYRSHFMNCLYYSSDLNSLLNMFIGLHLCPVHIINICL